MRQLKIKENEAYAVLRNMRVSPSKANSILSMIRGKKASDALLRPGRVACHIKMRRPSCAQIESLFVSMTTANMLCATPLV